MVCWISDERATSALDVVAVSIYAQLLLDSLV
jgi:hypothetical protein